VNADGIEFDWDEANLRHVARHGVTPEEAEEVVANDPLELEPQVVGGDTFSERRHY
jgi:uncharacterized DUF497 family protein